MCRRLAERQVLFGRMLERCDVDVVRAARLESGEAYARARGTCFRCEAAGACALWLAGAGECRPAFCPNLAFFRRCRRTRHAR
jgi:hypothetical protein